MSIDIVKWVKGWRLDKLFSHTSTGDISVQVASQQGIDFMAKVSEFINGQNAAILGALLGDKWNSLVVSANVIITEITSVLEGVVTLPDVATNLEQFEFSTDPKKNKIIHDIVTTSALIFSDGKISVSDAAFALILIQDF
jgi:hypothetical protein